MMLRMSATPAITLGMTHWSHSRRRRSISSVATGVAQNFESGGTEKFPSWNCVGSSPGRVHSRYPVSDRLTSSIESMSRNFPDIFENVQFS